MDAWEEYEQEELKRQAEWLRNERAKAKAPVKAKEKPQFFGKRLGRIKALFGSKE